MPTRQEAVRDELAQLRDDLRNLAAVVRQDPKKRARKERAWSLLYGALAAALTLASRRVATRAWWILTGRTPPAKGG